MTTTTDETNRKTIAVTDDDVERDRLRDCEPSKFTFEAAFDAVPEDDDGTPYVDIGGTTYRLPYLEEIPQNLDDPGGFRDSVAADGVRKPVGVQKVGKDTFDVVDGNTRTVTAWITGIEELPTYEHKESEDPLLGEFSDNQRRRIEAIMDNMAGRDVTPSMRRDLMRKIKSDMNWKKWKVAGEPRQEMLARIFGVSQPTISNDIKKIKAEDSGSDDDKISKIKTHYNRFRSSTSRILEEYRDTFDEHLSDKFDPEERKTGWKFVAELVESADELKRELDDDENDSDD